MASSNDSASAQEAAADYGIREACFLDHQAEPFRWQDARAVLQVTDKPADAAGIIEVPGLRPIQFHDQHRRFLLRESLNSFDTNDFFSLKKSVRLDLLLPNGRSHTNNLRLDTSLLDLGPDADRHVLQYLEQVRSVFDIDIRRTWLPLSSVNNSKDEGLAFPKRSETLHALLWREIHHDQPALPSQDSTCLEICDPTLGSQYHSWAKPSEPFALRVSEAPVPLLSPVSNSHPLVPEASKLVIDLCASPDSPVDTPTRLFLKGLETGHLESDPVNPDSVQLTQAGGPSPQSLGIQCLEEDDKKVDVPLPPASWDSQSEEGNQTFSKACSGVAAVKLPSPEPEISEQSTEAFESLLADRHERVMRSIKQEKIDPGHSFSRLAVPVLSFDLSPADDEGEAKPQPEECFIQPLLQTCHPGSKFDRVNFNNRLEAVLSWNPVPKGKGKINAFEEAPTFEQTPGKALETDIKQLEDSAVRVSHCEQGLIMQDKEDDELSEPHEHPLLPEARPQLSPEVTPITGAMVSEKPSLSELCRAMSQRRQSAPSLGQLKPHVDAEDMLAGFVELRTGKRRKLGGGKDHLSGSQSSDLPKNSAAAMSVKLEPPPDTQPVPPDPSFLIPGEKGHKIMSMAVGRSVIQNIAKVWPSGLLIDRDYSKHNTIAWSPGSAQTRVQTSPLHIEADISLNASTGVILTSLLKVRQRALPGSITVPPLRERIKQVSDLYEHLTVLVSEERSEADGTLSLVCSDLAVYTDFVQFATSLRKGVSVHFVPGHDETLSKWILSLFCSSFHTAEFERFLAVHESTWEVFLRRIGLNVYAAQVVAGLLQERIGASGLGSFLMMSRQERISAFEQVLGGQRVLTSVSNIIDMQWG